MGEGQHRRGVGDDPTLFLLVGGLFGLTIKEYTGGRLGSGFWGWLSFFWVCLLIEEHSIINCSLGECINWEVIDHSYDSFFVG